jgi:hypothetical protein
MLHLFDKVYIVSDTLININFDRVVISEKYGMQMLEALDKVAYGDLIAYSTTIEGVLANSSFPEFIQLINNKSIESDKKVIIYADDLNFSKFVAVWFKSIFNNISAKSAWLVLSSYIEKEKLMQGSREAYASTTSAIFTLLTEEQFVTDFNAAESYDLNATELSLSFEILLASYLINGSYKENLKSSIVNILKRTLAELAIEVKYSYVKNLKNSNYPVIEEAESFFTNSSIYTELNMGRVSSQHNTTDLSNATDVDIAKFKSVATKIMLDWELFKPESAVFYIYNFIDFIRKPELTDANLTEIIDFERNVLGTTRIFSSSDEEKINIYFLRHVLSSSASELAEYELK